MRSEEHIDRSCWRRASLAFAVGLASLLAPVEARAQRANYESLIFGERATGMAGATIALADEPSAVFYNPAGLAQLDYDILGVSVQAVGGVSTASDGLVRVNGAESSSSATTFGALPTSAAYSFPVGDSSTFALSIVTPVIQDVAYSHGLRSPDGSTLVVVESRVEEEEILMGPSYALKVGPAYFGATAYLEYAAVRIESLQAASVDEGGPVTQSLHRSRNSEGRQVGLTGVFGALVRFNERWSAGLRLRFPNLPLYGSSRHTFVESNPSTGPITLHDVEGTMTYPHPFSVGLGTAYRSRRLHVALDVKGYLPTHGYDLFGGDPQIASNAARPWDPTLSMPQSRFVANFALGVEAFLTKHISVLVGLHTDAAAMPESAAFDAAGSTTMSFIGARPVRVSSPTQAPSPCRSALAMAKARSRRSTTTVDS
jgi:long-subunit fatty acid transport protein